MRSKNQALAEYLAKAYPMTEQQKAARRAAISNLYWGPASGEEGAPTWEACLYILADYANSLPGEVYEDRDSGFVTECEPPEDEVGCGDWCVWGADAMLAAALGDKELATYL
jgi:hypothetical protein